MKTTSAWECFKETKMLKTSALIVVALLSATVANSDHNNLRNIASMDETSVKPKNSSQLCDVLGSKCVPHDHCREDELIENDGAFLWSATNVISPLNKSWNVGRWRNVATIWCCWETLLIAQLLFPHSSLIFQNTETGLKANSSRITSQTAVLSFNGIKVFHIISSLLLHASLWQ